MLVRLVPARLLVQPANLAVPKMPKVNATARAHASPPNSNTSPPTQTNAFANNNTS